MFRNTYRRAFSNHVDSTLSPRLFQKTRGAIRSLMPDEAYACPQWHLAEHPDAGAVIQDAGRLRKARWSLPGREKRGGVRVIYYYCVAEEQILLLLDYPKSELDDLTSAQKRRLRQITEKWHWTESYLPVCWKVWSREARSCVANVSRPASSPWMPRMCGPSANPRG